MVRVSKEQSGCRRPCLTPSWLRRCLVSDIKQNNQPDLAFPPPGLPPGPPSVPLLSQASRELVASLGLFPMAHLHCGIFCLPRPCSGAPSYLVTVVTLLLLLRCSGIFRSVWGGYGMWMPVTEQDNRSSRTGGAGGCELPDLSSGNLTGALHKSNMWT